MYFYARALIISEILTFLIFDLQKIGQCHGVLYLQLFDGQISNSKKVVPCIYAPIPIVSELLTFQIFDLEKVGQCHRVQLSQWCHSITNVKILKRNFVTFFIFAKIRLVGTIIKHTQTDTYTETDKAMAIGDFADLPTFSSVWSEFNSLI